MDKYSKLIRTTLGEYLSKPAHDGAGVYVIACYPALGCVYIGISNDVTKRLREHVAADTHLGNTLRSMMADACGWRLDVLVLPTNATRTWMEQVERALVQRYRPMCNTAMTQRTAAGQAQRESSRHSAERHTATTPTTYRFVCCWLGWGSLAD